uniref:Cryptic loci regulator 2 N-terminal domain-containing protein n=1 Tax=Kwoniella dejecticola CBS 10117 TaxID=1296121 RepID=A0A1A6AAJ5_9TREE|nr:uncharacterized protein I303_03111 [Kwoniella dejecticola CBS 10117]OBR87087.1 hypothetical protein I303_03111 [Kwoniella dejecticola CBS 10117]
MVKATHPQLVWPRSDGDPSRWPDTTHKSSDDSWYEEVGEDSSRFDSYSNGIAKSLVHYLNLQVDPNSQRIPMPEGYKIFVHKKKQPNGDVRQDFYLFGTTNTAKFRSVPEFAPHAIWLFDRSKPLDDHSTCECRYGKGGPKRQSLPSSATKRPSGSSPLKEGSAKKKKAVVEPVEDTSLPAVVPERAEELRSQRRFRRGELVWFRIKTINPPSNSSASGLTPITHWPGLVSNVPLKSVIVNPGDTASASASSAWTLFGGSAPSSLKSSQPDVIKYYEYHIRPLGMFSAQDEVIKDAKDVLPWQVGSELLGGEHGWDSIGHFAEKALKDGVKKDALGEEEEREPEKLDVEALLNKTWRSRWAKRIKFVELSEQYEEIVFRLSVALKTGSSITNSWAQTDKINVLPNDQDISAEDMTAILDQRKTLYQGLWWGGERIWLDDLVRLKKNRKDLPTGELAKPSDGAMDRGVFLKIRLIAIEVNNTTPTSTGWRCVLYGDLFELAKEGTPGSEPTHASNGGSDTSLVRFYKPPRGFAYKQLNEVASEVTVDVIDVAGRVYPDLLDGTTQSWFIDPSRPNEKEGRVIPGEGPLALAGLKSGTTVASKSSHWEEDLYSIVQSTTKSTETSMKDYYISLLRDEAGMPTPTVIQQSGNGQAGTLAEALGGLGETLKA